MARRKLLGDEAMGGAVRLARGRAGRGAPLHADSRRSHSGRSQAQRSQPARVCPAPVCPTLPRPSTGARGEATRPHGHLRRAPAWYRHRRPRHRLRSSPDAARAAGRTDAPRRLPGLRSGRGPRPRGLAHARNPDQPKAGPACLPADRGTAAPTHSAADAQGAGAGDPPTPASGPNGPCTGP